MTTRIAINKDGEVIDDSIQEQYDNLEVKQSSKLSTLDVLSRSSGTIRDKELGLSLTLINLAEVQAGRLQKLMNVIQVVESRIFTKEILKSLDPRSLLVLYKIASTNMDKTSEYVTSILKTVDWKELEARVALMDKTEINAHTLDDQDMKELAGTLLTQLTQPSNV